MADLWVVVDGLVVWGLGKTEQAARDEALFEIAAFYERDLEKMPPTVRLRALHASTALDAHVRKHGGNDVRWVERNGVALLVGVDEIPALPQGDLFAEVPRA